MDMPDVPADAESAFYFVGYEYDKHFIGSANEVFNRATHNSPLRMNLIQLDDKVLPRVFFSQVDDTENLDVFEACLHEVLNSRIVWPNVVRKDILEQLLQFFAAWAAPRVFMMQQRLEDDMNGLVSQAQKK